MGDRVTEVRLSPGAASRDRGLDDAAREVSDAVMAASRLFVAISARALGDIDPSLTLVQLRTLVVLDSQGPVKLAVLAAALGVNPSTAMRMVDKLEALSLVDRQVNPGNRREVVVRLTEDGHSLVGQVLARRHKEIAEIVARLPAGQRANLVEALQALTDAAGEFAVSAPAHPLPDDWRR